MANARPLKKLAWILSKSHAEHDFRNMLRYRIRLDHQARRSAATIPTENDGQLSQKQLRGQSLQQPTIWPIVAFEHSRYRLLLPPPLLHVRENGMATQ